MKRNLFVKLAVLITAICIPQHAEAANTEQQNISYVLELAKTASPEQLKQAVKDGYTFNVERPLDFDAPPKNEEDYDEMDALENLTPLHVAAAYNHNPGSIKYLLSLGLNVNAKAEAGNIACATPLSLAVGNKNFPAMKELLKAGADPESWCNDVDSTILHLVISEYTNPKTAKFVIDALLKAGADVNSHEPFTQKDIEEWELEDPENFTVEWSKDDPFGEKIYGLCHAARGNFMSSLTPLMFAVLYDKPDFAGILLDAGAALNPRSMEGKTALDYAMLLPNDSKLRRSPVFSRLKAADKKR